MSVKVTDTLGGVTSATTVVVAQPQPPVGVTFSSTRISPGGPPPTTVTLTATVTPSIATVASFLLDFGNMSSQTTSNQVVHTYSVADVYKVKVTVTTTAGHAAIGQNAVGVP